METLWWSCKECGCLFPSITYQPLCPYCKEAQDGRFANELSRGLFETALTLAIILGGLCWVLW